MDREFVGLGGHIVAIDVVSGSEIWRTKLKGSDVVTVCLAGNRVLGGTKGELFCLDTATGSILWHNPLKGLGAGILAFASSDAEVAAATRAAQEAAAVVVAST